MFSVSRHASFFSLAVAIFILSLMNSVLAEDSPHMDKHVVSPKKIEAWLDIQHRDQEARSGIDDDYSEQGFVRYTFRYGYTINEHIDLTPYIVLHGVNSWSDSFSFINNVEPGIGLWFRPFRSVFKKRKSVAADLLSNIRVLAEYSPGTVYTDDSADEFDQDGNLLRLAVDWYGEHRMGEGPLTAYVDVFSQYRIAEDGPEEALQWYSRTGLALDRSEMRFRIYGRWNGVLGFDSQEPWSNAYELGGGIAVQPFFGRKAGCKKNCSSFDLLLSDLRFYGEYLSVSYMDRNNGLYLESQPDSYVRFGIEIWFGRNR